MRKRSEYRIILVMCLFCMLMGTGIKADAAGKKVTKLKSGKTYSYDLDGDKKKEKIKVIAKEIYDDYYEELQIKIYVNGKEKVNKVIEQKGGGSPNIYLLDLNRKDSYKEIYVDFADFGGAFHAHVFRYSGTKVKQIAYRKDTNAVGCEYSWLNPVQPGDGTLSYNISAATVPTCCAPLEYRLSVRNGKMVQTSYLHKSRMKCVHKVLKERKATTTRTGKKTAFTVKKGSKIQILKVYAKNGLSFYIKNAKGKKGWVKTSLGREFWYIAS